MQDVDEEQAKNDDALIELSDLVGGDKNKGGEKPADFETAISAAGFGKYNFTLYVIAIVGGWSSLFETTTMSYVFPAAECDLGLKLNHKGLLNAVTYSGMISSAFLWGFLCDTLGRKKLLVVGFFLDGLFNLIGALSQNFAMLMTAKFLGGFIINGPYAALSSYLSEFHNAKHRSRVQLIIGTIFSLGSFVLPLLAMGIFPLHLDFISKYFDFHSWNLFLLICSLPPLISCVAFTFLPESPKFLMSVGQNEKALKVFRSVYRINTGRPANTYPIKYLVQETKQKNEQIRKYKTKLQLLKEGWSQIKPLFFPPHLSKILISFSMQFLIMMSLNSLRLWLPQIFQAIHDYQHLNNDTSSLCVMLEVLHKKNQTVKVSQETCVVHHNHQVYINSMIVAGTCIVGYVTAGSLINILGKKTLLSILGLTAGSMAMLLYFAKDTISTIALSSLFITFGSVAINVVTTVVVDVFPTSLRTMTVSLTLMTGRIGAALGNVIFPVLLQLGCGPPFFTLGSIMLVCSLLTWALPNTENKPLK